MLTITLASKSVLDQFKNWLYFFRDYKGFRLLAYCTDEESILFCEKNNIEYKNIIEAHRENGNNFWITKSYIFNETSKTDNFIYSDLDAIWIKNPIKYLKKFNNLEILFSQGTYFPEITRDRLGFVFCAGFFIVNNNEKLKLFFNEVYKLSKNSDINDDQYHLNTLLMYDFIGANIMSNDSFFFALISSLSMERKNRIGRGRVKLRCFNLWIDEF